MKNRKRIWIALTLCLTLLTALAGCGGLGGTPAGTAAAATTTAASTATTAAETTAAATTTAEITATPVAPAGTMILATTTSTEQTGLLAALLPDFTAKTGIEVKVVAVGTGQAIEMGKNGEADALLVHDKKSEVAFVEEGYGIERFDVMYNDFVLVGPKADPAGIKAAWGADIKGALKAIFDGKTKFVSRGDDSGTHKKELSYWKLLGLTPEGDWYVSAGKGMGEVLQMADELEACTLSDRGTYLSMKDKLSLEIVVEGAPELLNQYGVIAVNPEKNPAVHVEMAKAFVDWILSAETQKKIGEFGVDKFGQALFVPNAEMK